jgi:ketosteroid isomerase-like protein
LSYGHSGGHIDDKKEFVEKLASGASDFVTIDLSDQTISVSGKTAVVRHKLNAKTNDGGKPAEVHLLVLLIFQKDHRQWKLLARQAVKITS